MTSSIGHSFAAKPIQSDSYIVQRISSAVRTLVIGLSAMGTGIFGLAALGLFGLGIQVSIQRLRVRLPLILEKDYYPSLFSSSSND